METRKISVLGGALILATAVGTTFAGGPSTPDAAAKGEAGASSDAAKSGISTGGQMSSDSNARTSTGMPAFGRLDANADGEISESEAQGDAQLSSEFDSADADGDGSLSKSEFSAFEAQVQGEAQGGVKSR